MPELTGKQIETLRIGLQVGFSSPRTMAMFLRERLGRRYEDYVGQQDTFRAACFNIITSSEAEEWRDELILEAIKERPRNPNITKVGHELGLRVELDVEESCSAEGAAAIEAEPPLWRIYNPYRGMLALREQDANYLFGRDDDVDHFIDAIEMEPSKILLALGASGVGKSSLIFAGVLGALRRRLRKSKKPWPVTLEDSHKWPHLVLTPDVEPLYSLAGAFVRQWIDESEPDFRKKTNEWRALLACGDSLDGLVKAADAASKQKQEDQPRRYLIYVDQCEELYTRGRREPGLDHTDKEKPEQKEARRFSELLAEAAAHPRLIVLMSARSDFLGQLQADKRLSDGHPAKIFDMHRQLNIHPLCEDGLQQVITRPAETIGVSFENGLDKALTLATRKEIGSLPLLSYTLETLWQEMQARDDGTPVLRWGETVCEPINIAKKLADRADTFVKRHIEQQQILQRLFCVRLAHVPVQGDPTRQRIYLDELTTEEIDLVKELSSREHRIVVTGESEGRATAEVAHEKLFTVWRLLQTWLAHHPGFYVWATQIEAWRKDWVQGGCQPKDLLIGRPLDLARSYLETYWQDIPSADKTFIRESIAAKQSRDKEERRRKDFLWRIIISSLILISIFSGITTFFWWDATNTLDNALLQQSRFLSDASDQATLEGNASLGVLLALEALPDRTSRNPQQANRPYWPPSEVALEKAVRLLREDKILAAHRAPILSGEVTGDGSRLITGGRDGTLLVWDCKNGNLVKRLTGHTDSVYSLTTTYDGSLLVSASGDTTARVWDLNSGTELLALKHDAFVLDVIVSRDKNTVVTGTQDGKITVWNISEQKKILQIDAHKGFVWDISFTHDELHILSGSSDNSIRFWDLKTGLEYKHAIKPNANVRSIGFYEDKIIAGYIDSTLSAFDYNTGLELKRIVGHEDSITKIKILKQLAAFLTSSQDGTSRIWDAKTYEALSILKGHEESVNSVSASSDGSVIATGSRDKTARIWRRKLEQVSEGFVGHIDTITSIDVSYKQNKLVTGSWDNTARVWDAKTMRTIAILGDHKEAVTDVAIQENGPIIVTGSYDTTAKLWRSPPYAGASHTLRHENRVTGVDITKDGKFAVTGSSGGEAKVWQTSNGQQVFQLSGHRNAIADIAVSDSNSVIATSSADTTIILWSLVDGKKYRQLEGHEDSVTSIAFSRDGAHLVSGSADTNAIVWNVKTGAQILTLVGHSDVITSVSYVGNGDRIATSSRDGTTRIWHAGTGHQISMLENQKSFDELTVEAFGNDEIISNSFGTSAGVVGLQPTGQDLINHAKTLVPRCLTQAERIRFYLTKEVPYWCTESQKWPYIED